MNSNYCYPGTSVLKNILGLRNYNDLEIAERRITGIRCLELYQTPIKGDFDFKHLQKIHKHIFQDIYPFAGKVRKETIKKDNTIFCPYKDIDKNSSGIFDDLEREKFLKEMKSEQISEKLAHYFSRINYLHPFREGNGRALRTFIIALAENAGYELDFANMKIKDLFNASVKSIEDYTDLKNIFEENIKIIPENERKTVFLEEKKIEEPFDYQKFFTKMIPEEVELNL